MKTNKSRVSLWPAVAVLSLCVAANAQAQWGQPGGQQGGQPGGPPMGQPGMGWGQPGQMGPMGQPGQPGRGFDPRMAGMMMMGGLGNAAPAIAVAGDNVYVVLGNRIFRLDAQTLEILAQQDLPQPERGWRNQGGQGGPGGPGGQAGDANAPQRPRRGQRDGQGAAPAAPADPPPAP